jgi:hypothetical protein
MVQETSESSKERVSFRAEESQKERLEELLIQCQARGFIPNDATRSDRHRHGLDLEIRYLEEMLDEQDSS